MFRLGASEQSLTKLLSQFTSLFVASSTVRGGNHAADITKIDGRDAGNRSFGSVPPLGRLKTRGQLLTQRNQRVTLDLGHTLSRRQLVHSIDTLPQPGNPAPKDLFGKLMLSDRKRLESRLSMGTSGPQPGRLGTRRRL